MIYRLLHLPTATYLYHDASEGAFPKTLADLLTQQEIDNKEPYQQEVDWSIDFLSKKLVEDYIEDWCTDPPSPYFDFGNGRESILREHLEIIEIP